MNEEKNKNTYVGETADFDTAISLTGKQEGDLD